LNHPAAIGEDDVGHKSLGNMPLLVAILMCCSTSVLWAIGSITDILSPGSGIAQVEVTDRQVITTRQGMYDYLDGGAELYFDHGWETLVAVELKGQDSRQFRAEIYRVDTHQDALELLAAQQDMGDTSQVGDKSYYGSGMIVWVQGNFYARLWSWDVYDTVRQDVTALAMALANRLKEIQ